MNEVDKDPQMEKRQSFGESDRCGLRHRYKPGIDYDDTTSMYLRLGIWASSPTIKAVIYQ